MDSFEVGEVAHYIDYYEKYPKRVVVTKITETQITVVDDKQQKLRFRRRDLIMVGYFDGKKLQKFNQELADRIEQEQLRLQEAVECRQRLAALKTRRDYLMKDTQSKMNCFSHDEGKIQRALTQCELFAAAIDVIYRDHV